MLPLDLHVLGLPPAFTLSQDQTLHLKLQDLTSKVLSAEALPAPITRCICMQKLTWFCSNVC